MADKLAWRFLKPISGKCRILFAGPHFQAALPITSQLIDARGLSNVEIIHAATDEDVRRLSPSAHVAIPFMQRFPAKFFNPSTTPDLRLVIQFGVGLEGVDVDAASSAGVAVSNVPAHMSGNAEATAEHAIFLLIALLRRVDDLARRFAGRVLGGIPIPKTINGKKVAVVGYGAVGKVLCRYLSAMGANVTAVRRRPWADDRDDPSSSLARAESLEEAFSSADAVILACPTTSHTFHIINEESLGYLPQRAVIVNVGRGPLVSYSSVYDALHSGRLGGYASDVGIGHKNPEPWDPDDAISTLPNVFFTPHVGGYTDYSYSAMAGVVLDSVEAVVKGDPPLIWVNRPDTTVQSKSTANM